MQNSEFAYFSSKSGKHMKQMSNPPFWGDVGVKKWSPFFNSAARSPIFGHLNMPKVPIFRCPKMQKWPIYILVQNISRGHEILKTFWFFGAP